MRLALRWCSSIWLATVATACGRAAQSLDGSPPAPEPSIDAGAAPRDGARADTMSAGPASTITGTQVRRHFDPLGETRVVPNLTDVKVAAWSLSPAGEYEFFPGQGTADGRISVPDVPAGPFLLRFGSSYLASSRERTFELDLFLAGRADRPSANRKPTTLSIDLGGLSPWQSATDRVIFYAPAVVAGENLLHVKVPIGNGATTLMGSVDYTTFAAPALVDGGRGDEAWFIHQRIETTDAGQPVRVTKKAFSTKALVIADGQPASATGTMQDVPANQTLAVDWPVPEYLPLAAAISPVAGKMRGDIFIYASPNASERFGDFGWAGHILSSGVTATTPALKLTLPYADPYPPSWGRFCGAYMHYTVPVLIPGASAPVEVTAVIYTNDTVARFNAGPVRPIVTPPLDPKINGRSAFTETTGATTTPLVSWSPPAVGEPEVYKVFVMHARVSGGVASTSTVATLWTEDTSVRIPPEILQSGESYVLKIEALIEDGVSATRPFHRALHRGFAQLITARLTP
jgi:hypothetical protein